MANRTSADARPRNQNQSLVANLSDAAQPVPPLRLLGSAADKDKSAAGAAPIGASTKPKEAAPKLDKAAEMFKTVLSYEPNNVYAANGLGTVCVEKGRLQEAREIFTVVREAAAGCEPPSRKTSTAAGDATLPLEER